MAKDNPVESILKKALDHEEIFYLEDGFAYFWVPNAGAISAHELRALADALDLINEPLNLAIEAYFREHPG